MVSLPGTRVPREGRGHSPLRERRHNYSQRGSDRAHLNRSTFFGRRRPYRSSGAARKALVARGLLDRRARDLGHGVDEDVPGAARGGSGADDGGGLRGVLGLRLGGDAAFPVGVARRRAVIGVGVGIATVPAAGARAGAGAAATACPAGAAWAGCLAEAAGAAGVAACGEREEERERDTCA